MTENLGEGKIRRETDRRGTSVEIQGSQHPKVTST